MPKYELYDLPQETWDRFKARALRDGWIIKALFVQLMNDYGTGTISPSTDAAARPASGFFDLTCPAGHPNHLVFDKAPLRQKLEANEPPALHCWNCGARLALTTTQLAALDSWAFSPTDPRDPRAIK